MTPSRAWLAVCGLHGAASLLLWPLDAGARQALTWRAASWLDQPWTWWTSAWVHMNTAHLAGNLLALGALAVVGGLLRPDGRAVLAWLLAWPLTQLSLLLWPQVGYAVGLSGLLHAGTVVIAMQLALGRMALRHGRRWGVLLALGALAKTALERGWSEPLLWDAATGIPVVQAAHLGGVAWGLLLGALAAAWPARGLRSPGARTG